MNTQLIKQLTEIVGKELAGVVEKKLKEAKAEADRLGLKVKGLGFNDLDAQRAGQAELQRVQGLVDDFVMLATQALSEGTTDLGGLISELQSRLDLDNKKSLLDVVKEKLQPGKPFAAWRKNYKKAAGGQPWMQAIAAAATPFGGGGVIGNILSGNQTHTNQPAGSVVDSINQKVRFARFVDREQRHKAFFSSLEAKR